MKWLNNSGVYDFFEFSKEPLEMLSPGTVVLFFLTFLSSRYNSINYPTPLFWVPDAESGERPNPVLNPDEINRLGSAP